MWASRETILVHLAQSYRLIPSHIFFLFFQFPAELVRRNRLIRPLPSCPGFLLSLIFFGLTITLRVRTVLLPRITQGSCLRPCFTQQGPHLSPSSISLLSAQTSVRLSLPILFNVPHLCPFKPVVMLCTSQATPPLRLRIWLP